MKTEKHDQWTFYNIRISSITCLYNSLDFISILEVNRGIFSLFKTKDKKRIVKKEKKKIYFSILWKHIFLFMKIDNNRLDEAPQNIIQKSYFNCKFKQNLSCLTRETYYSNIRQKGMNA